MFFIMAGIAAVAAIVVSGLLIGTCLLISWMVDSFRGGSQRQDVRLPPPTANGRHRNGRGMPIVSRHGSR